MAVSPVHVRVPEQRPLAPRVTSVTSVALDKNDNEMIPGDVLRYPGICLTAKENPGKPRLENLPMMELYDHSSPQMGSLSYK